MGALYTTYENIDICRGSQSIKNSLQNVLIWYIKRFMDDSDVLDI